EAPSADRDSSPRPRAAAGGAGRPAGGRRAKDHVNRLNTPRSRSPMPSAASLQEDVAIPAHTSGIASPTSTMEIARFSSAFSRGGTGNAFLASLGVADVEEAVARIGRNEPRALDAGRVTWEAQQTRHFVGVFGVGFMAKVCDLANRRFKWAGARSYSLAVFPEV